MANLEIAIQMARHNIKPKNKVHILLYSRKLLAVIPVTCLNCSYLGTVESHLSNSMFERLNAQVSLCLHSVCMTKSLF